MANNSTSENADDRLSPLLLRRQELSDALAQCPYDLVLYLERAVVHSNLRYPDLAAGDSYRALLLIDEIRNDDFEYHEQAREALDRYSTDSLPDVLLHGEIANGYSSLIHDDGPQDPEPHIKLSVLASIRCFQILSFNLLLCGCLKSAHKYCELGLGQKGVSRSQELLQTKDYIETVARKRLGLSSHDEINKNDLPDRGVARREIYPWNEYEPDRFSQETLSALNEDIATMAPKCSVRVSSLPQLSDGDAVAKDGKIPTCNQLGVFANEDIATGEVVLDEYSLLTANNRLKEPMCDACATEIPPLQSNSQAVSCPECYDTVFCNDFCLDKAQDQYHPAVCDKDVDAIGKDPNPHEADESLYLLLLARLLAMAAHQGVHPLALREVKYIWGDFGSPVLNDVAASPSAASPPPAWTLPFSFHYNVEAPLHVLEKMDVDVFAELARFDLWVFNTAYAKFRGTASARKNPRDGRPDVAAVHPLWCLANHDCDPNVGWEWGGRMQLRAREKRVLGERPGGIKAGEEILNHYCDVRLPVQERREWAKGSLGGWCMCQRCRDEAAGGDSQPT